MKFIMELADKSHLNLNAHSNPDLQRHLDNPKAQVAEMIRQVNVAKYYGDIFDGRDLNFLDLGANLGIVSLFAAPHCKRVVAVEAELVTYHYLTLATEIFDNIECLHLALAPRTEPVKIAVDPIDYSCHTIVNPKLGSSFLKVPGATLPDILLRAQMSDVDVCKVDVEGAEMDSLTLDVIQMAPVKCWYIEVHRTPAMTREKAFVLMLGRLKSAGFTCDTPRPNAIIAKQ